MNTTPRQIVTVLAAFAAIGALVACEAPSTAVRTAATAPTPMETTPWTNGDAMPMPRHMAGAALDEYGYLAQMIPHHLEAIDAATQLARSERPEMRELGHRIVSAQRAEVERMQTWLRSWYPELPERGEYAPMMRDLDSLSGDALDAAFLSDMIPHHMHAVMTSQMLLAQRRAEHAPVVALAIDIRNAQRREISLMRGWQVEWFGGQPGTVVPPSTGATR